MECFYQANSCSNLACQEMECNDQMNTMRVAHVGHSQSHEPSECIVHFTDHHNKQLKNQPGLGGSQMGRGVTNGSGGHKRFKGHKQTTECSERR